MNNLTLKWGTVKGWDFDTLECKAGELLKRYIENSPVSCMADHPDDDRKKLLCSLIDEIDGEICNDWSGEVMTKEDAKKYVMDYGG